MIRVGCLLYGYCDGYFDNSYYNKRVESVGQDWVVAREIDTGRVVFYYGNIDLLLPFIGKDGQKE